MNESVDLKVLACVAIDTLEGEVEHHVEAGNLQHAELMLRVPQERWILVDGTLLTSSDLY